MRVFILCTGRCGSTTFIKACERITNYTAGHESRAYIGAQGDARITYPDGHIEADNRLTWLLGRLDRLYGDDAIYVHLKRNREKVARSFMRRAHVGNQVAFRFITPVMEGVQYTNLQQMFDLVDTMRSNIDLFMRDKSRTLHIQLEDAKEEGFPAFWEMIGAEGDYAAALAEFDIRHNAYIPEAHAKSHAGRLAAPQG